MKIEYKNYVIESDRNSYILKVFWDRKNPKTWEVSCWLRDEIYPATLEKCLIRIFERETAKITKIELKEIIEELKLLEEQFIKDIKKLLKH